MSTNLASFPTNNLVLKDLNELDHLPKNTITKRKSSNSKLNKKLTKISNKIHPESVLFTMIKLIVENRDQINVVDSVLSINSKDLDLVQKLNYCMEFLAHIPFSFQYNKLQTKILLEFFHLEEEMDIINNLEI